MCFHRSRHYRSRHWEERAEEGRSERLWDLFYRETDPSEPPITVVREGREGDSGAREPDEVPVGAER